MVVFCVCIKIECRDHKASHTKNTNMHTCTNTHTSYTHTRVVKPSGELSFNPFTRCIWIHSAQNMNKNLAINQSVDEAAKHISQEEFLLLMLTLISLHPLSWVCSQSSLTSYPSCDRHGGRGAGCRRKGLDQSVLMNHSTTLLTEMLSDLPHLDTHTPTLIHEHARCYDYSRGPLSRWHAGVISCSLHVHRNMGSTKSHNVESSLHTRLIQSPWRRLHVQLPWTCPTSTAPTAATTAHREVNHIHTETWSTHKIWWSHLVSL